MSRIVLFDVARLVNRAKAPTPTGIDRVDVMYLEHFMDQPATQVVGVIQKQGRLIRLPERDFGKLRRLVRKSWIEGKGLTPAEIRRARYLKLRSSIRGSMAQFWNWRRGPDSERRLDPALLGLAAAHPEAETFYVNCSHNGIKSRTLFDAIRTRLKATLVFFVHDVIPIDFPQYSRKGFGDRHAQRMALIGEVADLVIANSTYSRDRFTAFCDSRGITVGRTTVLHIGIEPAIMAKAGIARETQAPDPYFVALGTIEPRKNLSLLLRAWKALRAQGGPVPQLRLIGKRGWVTEENRDFDDLLAAVAGDVVELGPLTDDAMIAQMAGARALLFPSFAEGWGMPLVEAQTLGTPVIASEIDAFREASQGLAEFLSPTDDAGWADAVRRYTTPDSSDAPRRRAALEDFAPPTWELHFRKLEAALDAVKSDDADAERSPR